MTIDLDISAAWLVSATLVMARVSGLVLAAPFLGSLGIPTLIRIVLTLSLSLAMVPVLVEKVPIQTLDLVSVATGVLHELVVGILLGFVGQIFLSAFQMAGQIIGFQMGFSVINIIDPQTQVEASVLSLFEGLLGLMVFLSLDAHHWFIQAVADSYLRILPLSLSHPGPLASHFLALFEDIFVVGFKLAAPVTLVLIVTDVLLGVIGRAAPQIHVLIVGMPMKPLIGFLFLLGTAQARVPFMYEYLTQVQGQLYRFLELMR